LNITSNGDIAAGAIVQVCAAGMVAATQILTRQRTRIVSNRFLYISWNIRP